MNSTIKEKRQLDIDKRDVAFLLGVVVIYMFTCIQSPFNPIAQTARFFILPLMIVVGVWKSHEFKFDSKAVLLFSIAVLPSIIVSDHKSDALLKSATIVLLFIAASVYFKSRADSGLQSMYYSLLFASYLLVITSFIYKVSGQGIRAGYYIGYFGNRNGLGAVLVMAFAILLAETWRKKNFFTIICLLLDVYLVLQCQSRGAFLSMIVCAFVFLFFVIKNKTAFFSTIIAILVFIALLWGPISSLDIVQRIFNEGAARDELWDYGWQVIKAHPVFGVGFSCSQFSNHLEGTENMNFHNSYIGIMADVGFFGTIVVVCLFAYLIKTIYTKRTFFSDENNPNRLFFIALVCLCISFLFLSYGEGYLLAAGSPFSFLFWCCVFCLASFAPIKYSNNFLE